MATKYFYAHTILTSNKNFILKYFRCRDGKRTETRIGMEGICITHSCIPLYTVYMQHIMAHSGGMQEWVIQITSITAEFIGQRRIIRYLRYSSWCMLAQAYCTCRASTAPRPLHSTPTAMVSTNNNVFAPYLLILGIN